MIKLTTIAAVAALSLGVAGTANAIPLLQIVGTGGGALDSANQEAIGDNGGSSYPFAGSTGAAPGAGIPTDLGGWPNNYPSPGTTPPGFAQDTGLPPGGGNYGISGWDGSYLKLEAPGTVRFQFMGKGDATDNNLFQLSFDGGTTWTTIWDTQSSTNGTCAVGAGGSTGPTDVRCNSAGSSFTYTFSASQLIGGANLIPFRFENLTTPATATNDGSNNPRPDLAAGITSGAGYFLGMDPYLATSAFLDTGYTAYAGFTDRPCTATTACDHDYEDLAVRISSVPEPGTIFLLGAGLLGVGVGRRKMAARSV